MISLKEIYENIIKRCSEDSYNREVAEDKLEKYEKTGIMECGYCMRVRDDNMTLLEDDDSFNEIRFKGGEYRLYLTNTFRVINFCPICGRELE